MRVGLRRRVIGVAVAALGLLSIVPATTADAAAPSLVAADPPGTIVLSPGVGGRVSGQVTAVTSQGFSIWSHAESDAGSDLDFPFAGGDPVGRIATGGGRGWQSCTGDDILSLGLSLPPGGVNGVTSVDWVNASTRATGTSVAPAGSTFIGRYPGGFLVSTPTTGPQGEGLDLAVLQVGSTSALPLGHVLGRLVTRVACDANSVALSNGSTVFVGSVSTGLTSVVDDPASVHHVAAVNGSTVIYWRWVPNSATGQTVRLDLGNGTGAVTEVVAQEQVATVAASPLATAYTVAGVAMIKARGAAATRIAGVIGYAQGVFPVPTGFLVSAADIRVLADGASSATTIPTDAAKRPRAVSGVDFSAGRVVLTDNRDLAGRSTWSRALTAGPWTADSDIAVGTTQDTSTGPWGVSASGRRIALPKDGVGVVTDGVSTAAIDTSCQVPRLRGHVAASCTSLTDLSNLMRTTVAGAQPSAKRDQIWGDLALVHDNGTVLLVNIRTSAATPLDRVPAGWNALPLALAGDLAVWSSSGPGNVRGPLVWRNLRTGRDGTLNDPVSQVWVYGEQIAYQKVVDASWRWPIEVLDTRSGAITQIVPSPMASVVPNPMVLTGFGQRALAWSENVPPGSDTHTVKLSPVPDQHLAPRHEGNPLGAGAIDLTRPVAWRGEWVFTEPLTTCSVTVKDGSGAVVRSLSCDPTFAAQGEAVVDWDGKTTAGVLVAPGDYTTTVVAGDEDGPVVDVDGVVRRIGARFGRSGIATRV